MKIHVTSMLLPALGLAAGSASAAYVLQDDYSPDTFFDKFSFFTDRDPTNGFVDYVDRGTAESGGLISTGSSVYMGVDHANVASSGRRSVRLSSTQTYHHGLFIIDLGHMPTGCGTWPAFWILGPNWPNGGEIDIIENVNDATSNHMTLHTSDGCSIDSSGFSGTLLTSNCYAQAPGQDNNAGCGIQATSSNSYGAGFNSAGGGVYATEWTGDHISIWFFPRSSVPGDISSGNPNPSSWGTPAARFAGSCDIESHFTDMQIIFDITFCGDWAGNVWGSGSCSAHGSCQDYVANNPSAFSEAYWDINSLRVYQDSASAKKRAPEAGTFGTTSTTFGPQARGFPRRSMRAMAAGSL
ncbi:concanavalin A-like lectin/glucanase domain-containing protein [Aspergillus pseudoustus]|uniref:Concanavalin A-like lectin/glucanase domain-containing protein n=1 Tax=Aspergillus pseudoustus TaxID=1810923 RepID=A0ABR4KA78_9EURO